MKEAAAEEFRGMSGTGSPYLFCRRKARISGPSGAVAAALLLTLGACSGSDFKKLGGDFGDHVAREVFGVDPSGPEGPEEQKARARDFARRADALVATGAHAGSSPVATPTCARAGCLWTGEGASPARTISDLFPADISGVARGAARNGATDFQYRGPATGEPTATG